MDVWHARLGVGLAALATASVLPGCGRDPEPRTEVGVTRAALLGTEVGVFVTVGTGTPSARSRAMLTFDAKRKVGVLFGGFNGSPLSETWEWDGAAWAQRCTAPGCSAQVPSARSTAAAAFASANSVTVLFGGIAGATGFCDTWEWDGAVWSPKLTPADCTTAVPRERTGHAMADDGSRGVVLFGGIAGGAYANDLYGWNGTAWSTLCTGACAAAPRPSPRYGASLVRDTTQGALLLFGGRDGTNKTLNDLWQYDGAADAWTELCTGAACTGQAPPARYNHGAAFDSIRGRLFVYAGCGDSACSSTLGDAYEWDGSTWSPSATGTAKFSFGTMFDAERHRVIEYGGSDDSGVRVADTVAYYTRGASCLTGATCDTGQCVDGVCCESAACRTCERCDGPGANAGLCTPVVSADDDTCSGTGTCDANGLCKKKNGQGCGVIGDCASGHCSDQHCCNTDCTGSCLTCGNASGTCTAVTSASDPDTCAAPAQTCDAAGACKKAGGQQCSDPAQCASGSCADGVCCNTACSGGCDVCVKSAGATADGTCTVLGAQAIGVGCGRYRCAGAAECPANGCAGDGDCAPGNFCNGGSCLGQKTVGAACTTNSECAPANSGTAGSGYCVDGVCCSSPCTNACSACSAALKETGITDGECGPVRAGTDPDDECEETPKTGCGQDGLCDGHGICELWLAGTDCSDVPGTNICVGTHAVGHVCDGVSPGTCTTDRAGTDCSPGKCVGGTCPGCANDGDCIDSAYCRSGRCATKRAQGAACTTNDQCAGGFCVDGVCCVSVCDRQCEWCGDPASAGECVPITGAPKPGRAACSGEGACAGACDGKTRDGCAYPSSATACNDASCIGDWRVGAGRCDSAGLCAIPDATDCGASTCRDGECTKRCAIDTDCARGAACDPTAGACSADGAECVGGFSVKAPNGTVRSCDGFRCEGTSCRYQCTADADCAPGYACGPRGCARVGGDAGLGATSADAGARPKGQASLLADAGKADAGEKAGLPIKASADGCGCRTAATRPGEDDTSQRRSAFGLFGVAALLLGRRRRTPRRRSVGGRSTWPTWPT